MSSTDIFLSVINDVIDKLKDMGKSMLIMFSDDGDGLSSAYILTIVMEKMGKEYTLVSLDKVFPEALKRLFDMGGFDGVIFVDLGGALYHYIPRDYYGNVIIIDHHIETIEFPSGLTYINPYIYGFKEEDSPVSSIIAYYILKKIDKDAPRYAWAASIGLGESPYEPIGLNWRVIYEGIRFGNIKKGGKSFSIKYHDLKREYRSLYRDITLVSSAGYFDDMPLEIIGILKYSYSINLREYVDRYRSMRMDAYRKLTSLLEEGMSVKDSIQWFEDYKDFFINMGTRIFDSYVTYVSHQARLYDKDKYLIGISRRKPYIPGLGYLTREWLNIAVRVSKKMEFRIRHGYRQPVSALIEAAAYNVGGIGYGYATKGSCIIPYPTKDEFINIFNELAREGAR